MKTVIYKGSEVEFVCRNGGWTTILTNEGRQVKVRNGEVKDVKATPAPKAAAAKPVPAPKVKAEKPAKEATPADASAKLLNPDLTRYVAHDTKTVSGRRSLDIADDVADLLRGQHIHDTYDLVAERVVGLRGEGNAKTLAAELRTKYQHLNVGMQRMNLGNFLRGEHKRAERRAAGQARAAAKSQATHA